MAQGCSHGRCPGGSLAAVRGWEWVEMSWNWCETSWGAVASRACGLEAAGSGPGCGLICHVPRPGLRPVASSSQPPLQDVSHQFQDISTHFNPLPPTYSCWCHVPQPGLGPVASSSQPPPRMSHTNSKTFPHISTQSPTCGCRCHVPQPGLEPVASSSQARLATAPPGCFTPIPRHFHPFLPTPAYIRLPETPPEYRSREHL